MAWKATRCIFGYLWAALLLLAGAWLWAHGERLGVHDALTRTGGVLGFAGGVFVFMVLVADELLPRTPVEVRGFLKIFVGVVWWLALVRCGWLGLTLWF